MCYCFEVGRVTGLRHFWIPGCGALLSTDAFLPAYPANGKGDLVNSELSVTSGDHTETITT